MVQNVARAPGSHPRRDNRSHESLRTRRVFEVHPSHGRSVPRPNDYGKAPGQSRPFQSCGVHISRHHGACGAAWRCHRHHGIDAGKWRELSRRSRRAPVNAVRIRCTHGCEVVPASVGPDGALVMVGHVHCAAASIDHRLNGFPDRLLTVSGYPDWQEHPALTMMFGSMLMLRPPEHTRFAGRCRPLSLPGRVAALRPAISRITDELCDQIDGTVDVVERFAFPLPVTVIGELLGIPTADRPMFQGSRLPRPRRHMPSYPGGRADRDQRRRRNDALFAKQQRVLGR
jgi:hypothetical protein